eukprot:6214028-Pleurochrysis_carterae.AAC.2
MTQLSSVSWHRKLHAHMQTDARNREIQGCSSQKSRRRLQLPATLASSAQAYRPRSLSDALQHSFADAGLLQSQRNRFGRWRTSSKKERAPEF